MKKKAKLRAIDGSDPNKAPAPKKLRSKTGLIYRTIRAFGPQMTAAEIMECLPAAIDDAAVVFKDADYLRIILSNAVRSGYLIHNEKGDIYEIAPRSYYDERRRLNAALAKENRERRKVGRPNRAPAQQLIVRMDWKAQAWTFIAGATIGLLGGLLIGQILA